MLFITQKYLNLVRLELNYIVATDVWRLQSKEADFWKFTHV